MGYTHYWQFYKPVHKLGEAQRVDALYKKTLLECAKVVRYYNSGIKALADKHPDRLSGFSAHTKPGTYGGLQVNGTGSRAHEPFELREHYRDAVAAGFDFCKTAVKPYDIVVVACLCILKHRLGDLVRVGSDGDRINWRAGAQLASRALGKPIGVPESIEARAPRLEVVG